MKRFLIATIDYPPNVGGVANYYYNLARFWPMAGEVVVIDNNDGNLVRRTSAFFAWRFAFLALYKKIVSGIDYAIVGQILPLGTVAFLMSLVFNFKYCVVLHGLDWSMANNTKRKRFLIRFILSRADKIICANNFTEADVLKFVKNTKKVFTVNPGVDLDIIYNIKKDLRIENNLEGKKIILSVGRFIKRKGFDRVIRALKILLKDDKNIFYVLIGSGELREYYKKLVKDLKIEKNVIIKEADDQERNGWYESCDVFAMPAYDIDGDYEGFGIVYLEASLFGKAVLAGDCGGIGDAVVGGVSGLLVDGENYEQVLSGLEVLLRDDALRNKLGKNGMKRTAELFSWSNKAKDFRDILIKKF